MEPQLEIQSVDEPGEPQAGQSNGRPNLPGPSDLFVGRHLGPSEQDVAEMLGLLGYASLDELIDATVPGDIRLRGPLGIGPSRGEFETLEALGKLAARNQVFRSCIGMGYSDCITPPVIQRNILENPGWYTQYTPYQAEISQGRLEALLNFQTLVCDLCGLPLANASLLDEASAAGEAMSMCRALVRGQAPGFFIADDCHPQTISLVTARAQPLGIKTVVGPRDSVDFGAGALFGLLLQYPATDGRLGDPSELIAAAHAAGALVVVAADLLALTLLKPPGEMGADIVVGSTQRFGVPMGYGGPHAAFLSCRQQYARKIPGRIVGLSRDASGRPALRLAIQTREQHIKRQRATSNICTAQVLPAILASMYAVYHGPEGLAEIARRVHAWTSILAEGLRRLGHGAGRDPFFDTLHVDLGSGTARDVLAAARQRHLNLRAFDDGTVGVSLDETTTRDDVQALLESFATGQDLPWSVDDLGGDAQGSWPDSLRRRSTFLTHEVFNRYHAEHEMLRYIRRLESRDLSLGTSMIPLGSCTMKLNGTTLMVPLSWPQVGRLHPFAPREQARGYAMLFAQLEAWLADITGLAAVSLQPNAGSVGEYTGLRVIRAYHEARGDRGRTVCLIPVSAHGTNPASAAIAGFDVVAVACDPQGNLDMGDLESKAQEHAARLGALMITYPSTHGVFEESVRQVCDTVHARGGQVYLDGANMNALVGLCRPGDIGVDVCHLNLHKTFCIPHGGGGPGMGPIAVREHLAPFLPTHPVVAPEGAAEQAIGPVAAAPYGSPSILPISYCYIALMGSEGLTNATRVAILNANYMAKRLEGDFPILYRGRNGRVAHEFIVDCRSFERTAGIRVEDIAKRLMDYGFHAPTMSWPVPGSLMIEPTESESKAELDRYCEALISIRGEIRDIEEDRADRDNNVLKHAPHPAEAVTRDQWDHPYGREQAAYPAPWLRESKFWPPVARIDNPYGDRNLVCTCS